MREIYLPLHSGKAPLWLLNKMKKLAFPIVKLIISEYGEKEFLERISNPIFFQSLSNVLGFDWNSSGSTTVLTSVLKFVLNRPDFGIRIAGGKGSTALKTPEEVKKYSKEIGADGELIVKFSRLAAKSDNCALIDGYTIYHHTVIFSEKYMTVVQQGMNPSTKMARRYHWRVFRKLPTIEEIHGGIISNRKELEVINMPSKDSREARRTCVDIIRDGNMRREFRKLSGLIGVSGKLVIPRKINWEAVERAYDLQPEKFEDLLLVRGIGRETIRALALISDLIYNVEYDRQDPVKYSFAVGGKDGVPFPVRRDIYDEVIEFMEEVVRQTSLGEYEKLRILKRLRSWK
ncbi:hypothetical protein B6U96_15415 [Archaeoglobales archaeon ex4484_92]|nr:MAG: hypothetical protein B6U96_15415 [Archaeoglobales archaeon ex4484_92]